MASALHVFLCHSSADKPSVRNLYQRLLAEGFDPWLDEENLLPGQLWEYEIPKAVKRSHVVIVCLSSKSVTGAGYVQKEIRHALDAADEQPEGTIFIIPLKLEVCELPDRLARWHCVSLFEERGYENLLKGLRARAKDLHRLHERDDRVGAMRTTRGWVQSWGIAELEIDQKQLAGGAFGIHVCRGVLPNGTQFCVPETHSVSHSLDVSSRFGGSVEYLRIFLCESPEDARQLSLSFEEDLDVVAASMPIGQVRRDDARGELVLDPFFIPPCLTIRASSALLAMLNRLVEVVANRIKQMEVRRQQRTLGPAESTNVAQFSFLQTLAEYAPEFRHILLMQTCTPEQLFITMLRFAGSLSAFSLESTPLEFPAYDHNDLGSCFSLLNRQISAALVTVVPSRCVFVPMSQVQKHTWAGTFSTIRLTNRSQLYLAVSARTGVDELLRRVPQLVKIAGTAETLEKMVRFALPGASLRHEPVPPAEIPLRPDAQYFAMEFHERVKAELYERGTLIMYLPEELPEPKIEVLIVTD